MINGRGRAPLIVIPDTGTRLQTKQEWSRVPLSITFSRKAQSCSEAPGEEQGAQKPQVHPRPRPRLQLH